MPSLINAFVPIEIFLKEAERLIRAAELYVYTKKTGAVRTVVLFDWSGGTLNQEDNGRVDVFITAEPFDESKYKHFYDDNFFMYVIEVKGGRCTDTELEMLGLRVVSKSPDKRIKLFMNKLQKYLKENAAYGRGIGQGNYHSKIFYHREEIKGKTLWSDFDHKIMPVNIQE